MRTPAKPPAQTKEDILSVAEARIRTMGLKQVNVGDIASDLGMSASNIYRFFEGKVGLREAVFRRIVERSEQVAWEVVQSKGSAAERLVQLAVDLHVFNHQYLVKDKHVYDMVSTGMDELWEVAKKHIASLKGAVEQLIAEGYASGEFKRGTPEDAAEICFAALTPFWNPDLIAHMYEDPTGEAAGRMGRFLGDSLKHG